MKINKDTINDILTESKKKGFDVRIKDISYVLLCQHFEDKEVAYRSIFPSNGNIENDIKIYENSKEIRYVKQKIEDISIPEIYNTKQKKKKTADDISFEENKAYMLKLKKDTETAMENGEIDKKDGLKILADISVKLNDKFQVQDETAEQLVIVSAKYSSICPYCNHEIAPEPISKEEAMRMYNLTEK